MVLSRVIIRVTPFRALITLLITYLLSPLPLQVPLGHMHNQGPGFCWLRVYGSGRKVQGFCLRVLVLIPKQSPEIETLRLSRLTY